MPLPLLMESITTGSPSQRAAQEALRRSQVWEHLGNFHPVLVGTVPLDIDIPGSDLDILCEVYEFKAFALHLQTHFGHLPDFSQKEKTLNGVMSHIARFSTSLFPIEIVGQPLPIPQQRAYRHMIAEFHLLQQGGDPAREAIRALKRSGMKTEPAFGQYFQLKGDPYQALLDLEANLQYPVSNI